ncbi:MAG TPA: hypothetical protein VGL94_17280 [Ktedonobacteraceae bacterium]
MERKKISQVPYLGLNEDLQKKYNKIAEAAANDPNSHLNELRRRNYVFRGTPPHKLAQSSLHEIRDEHKLKTFVSETEQGLKDYKQTATKEAETARNRLMGHVSFIRELLKAHRGSKNQDIRQIRQSFKDTIARYTQAENDLEALGDRLKNTGKEGQTQIKGILDESCTYKEKEERINKIRTKQKKAMEEYHSREIAHANEYEQTFRNIRQDVSNLLFSSPP